MVLRDQPTGFELCQGELPESEQRAGGVVGQDAVMFRLVWQMLSMCLNSVMTRVMRFELVDAAGIFALGFDASSVAMEDRIIWRSDAWLFRVIKKHCLSRVVELQ